MPFGLWTRVRGPKEACRLDKGAHWRHLANTTGPSLCCDDAALRQITLTIYYYHYHHHRRLSGSAFVVANETFTFIVFVSILVRKVSLAGLAGWVN